MLGGGSGAAVLIQQVWASGREGLAGALHDPRFTVHQDARVEGVLGGQQECSVGGGGLDVEVARERRADRDRDGEGLEFHTSIVDTVGPHSFINVDAGPLSWRDARFVR